MNAEWQKLLEEQKNSPLLFRARAKEAADRLGNLAYADLSSEQMKANEKLAEIVQSRETPKGPTK